MADRASPSPMQPRILHADFDELAIEQGEEEPPVHDPIVELGDPHDGCVASPTEPDKSDDDAATANAAGNSQHDGGCTSDDEYDVPTLDMTTPSVFPVVGPDSDIGEMTPAEDPVDSPSTDLWFDEVVSMSMISHPLYLLSVYHHCFSCLLGSVPFLSVAIWVFVLRCVVQCHRAPFSTNLLTTSLGCRGVQYVFM